MHIYFIHINKYIYIYIWYWVISHGSSPPKNHPPVPAVRLDPPDRRAAGDGRRPIETSPGYARLKRGCDPQLTISHQSPIICSKDDPNMFQR